MAKQHEDKLRGSQDLQRSMANLSVSNNVSRKTLLNVKNPVSTKHASFEMIWTCIMEKKMI